MQALASDLEAASRPPKKKPVGAARWSGGCADTGARGHGDQSERGPSPAPTGSRKVQTASHSVADVASSTEQLSNSIMEISQLITRLAQVTQETDRFLPPILGNRPPVASLSECASGIGEIVGLIESIANQTNLLARTQPSKPSTCR